MSTPHEGKKGQIYQKTAEILREHEKGMSKNELIHKLEDAEVCTRVTFYSYFDQMIKDNIIEFRKVGKQQHKCFSTVTNKILAEFQEKVKIVNELLDLVEKNPTVGDCFTLDPLKAEIPDWMKDYLPEFEVISYASFYYNPPWSHTEYGEMVPSLRARHDLLKNLPLFLTYYINKTYGDFSQQIKDKCINILSALLTRCVLLLQSNYDLPFLTHEFEKLLKNMHPKGELKIIAINPPERDMEVDFLRILGRYYYLWSCEKKDFEYNNIESKKIIVTFIKAFFPQPNEVDDKKAIKTLETEHHHHPTKETLGVRYRLSLKLGEEPFVVMNYYSKLFSIEGLFSNTISEGNHRFLDKMGKDILKTIEKEEEFPYPVICYDCGNAADLTKQE